MRERIDFLFLNVGHFFDHLFMLLFASVAALTLARQWGMGYAELIPYATPGFVAFGVCALPAGWVADKWSRKGMMVIFFIGIGASSMATSLARSPLEISIGLTTIGIFAAIYHPVGLAMVVHGRAKTGMALAVNGVFGNFGVAAAALIAGYLIDASGWRWVFILPGLLAIATGILYAGFLYWDQQSPATAVRAAGTPPEAARVDRRILIRVFAVIFISTGLGGLVYQSTTFSLPKIFDERLGDLAGSATMIGWYAFLVFAIAAFAQIVVGWLVDRHSIRLVFGFVAGLQILFFAIMPNLTGAAALIVATAFMLVVFGQIPINDVLVGRMTRSEWRSRMFAARYIVTFSVSATAIPVIAWVHGRWGFPVLFMVLAFAAAIILAAVLTLPRTQAVTGVAPAE
ncbi:MAG: MFS transporter [Rhodospirillales bacterium]|nr:MFS transporter [Rhodospirillales bacterium]